MTEGPQAHLITDRIRTALAGRRLERLQFDAEKQAWPPDSYAGRRVVGVECHGKEIFLHLDGDETFRIHLLMRGAVRIGPAQQELASPIRLGLWAAGTRVAVIGAPSIRRMTRQEAAQRIRSLGPDACVQDFDAGRFRRNLQAQGAQTLAECLLDQSVVAGIGNMWKSEILFDCGLDPRTPADALDLRRRAMLAKTVHSFMRGVLETKRRGKRTRLRVYHRSGKPCLSCDATIEGYLVADRTTYSCPTCQPRQRTV